MNKDEEKRIRDIVISYLNANLYNLVKHNIYDIDRKERTNFIDFMYDHEIMSAFVIGCLTILLLLLGILGFGFAVYKIDTATVREKANICVETGYGCESNTHNTDIKYDNTPIVEVKNESNK